MTYRADTDPTTSKPAAARQGRHDDAAMPGWFAPLPGLALCLLGALAAAGLHSLVPALPAMLAAILLGAVLANAIPLPEVLSPGVSVAATQALRLGVVLLGLSIALSDVLSLGWSVLAMAMFALGCGVKFTDLWQTG